MTKSRLRIRPTASAATAVAGILLAPLASASIFPPAAGQPGSTAIPADSPLFVQWASAFSDYVPGPNVGAQFQTPGKALGPPGNSDGTNVGFTFDIVSLGDNGRITLSFPVPLRDGPGPDFAVFENSFSNNFLELAYVEVSSDGSNFVRFPAFSLTPGPVGGFGSIDPRNIEGVAGKYRAGFGTPFDLAQLAGSPGLDLTNVPYVRLVDIKGDGSDPNDLTPAALADYLGLPLAGLPPELVAIAAAAPAAIFDPFPTTNSGGFDLDAVGAINVVPVPAAAWLLSSGLAGLAMLRRRHARVAGAMRC
jgi:hypothetical protein